MSTGHNLVRSSHVVCAEMVWVPSTMKQAEDRCHRIRQVSCVHVEHLVYDDSLDARMVDVVFEKDQNLFAALDKVTEAPATVPEIADTTDTATVVDEDALREIEAAADVAVAERAERKLQEQAEEEARREAAASPDAEVREAPGRVGRGGMGAFRR